MFHKKGLNWIYVIFFLFICLIFSYSALNAQGILLIFALVFVSSSCLGWCQLSIRDLIKLWLGRLVLCSNNFESKRTSADSVGR